MRFIRFIASGEIIESGECNPERLADQTSGPFSHTQVLAHPTADRDTHKVVAGVVIAYSEAGRARKAVWHGEGFRWDTAAEDWVDEREIGIAQAQAWEAIKVRREVSFAATVTSSAGIAYSITHDKSNLAERIDSLSAAVELGLVPVDTAIDWRDRNNDPHALDLIGLKLLAAEMGMRGQAIFGHSWALDAQVKAATTTAELSSIDIEAGWP